MFAIGLIFTPDKVTYWVTLFGVAVRQNGYYFI